MNFHKPSIRLAGLYLAIMMVVSLFFSAIIYEQSVQELDRGLRRPSQVLQNRPGGGAVDDLRQALEAEREELYETSQQRVLNRLIITNLAILLAAGALSYYLAKWTLKPIEEAHDELSRFTADASHELRTPIAAMQTETEVALMNPKLTLTTAKQQLSSNLEELAKLNKLTEGLLRLARLENNGLAKEDVDMKQVVKSAVDRVKQQSTQKKIKIKTSLHGSSTVIGDEASLIEVLAVVLDNAVKHSPKGGQVKVDSSEGNKQVKIEVVDEGPGIKASALPHIFERFYQADPARSKQTQEGYGLGLAIAKDIVEKHHGSISATSKLDKGSTFTVILPIK